MGSFVGRAHDRGLWIIVGLTVVALVAFALYQYVGTLISAVFLYYATRPIEDRIAGYIDHDNLAVALTLFVVVLPVMVIGSYALWLIGREIQQLLATGAFAPLRPYLQPYLQFVRQGELRQLGRAIASSQQGQGQTVAATARRVLASFTNVFIVIVGFIAKAFLLTLFLFYLLRDDSAIKAWFYESVDHDDRIVTFLNGIDEDLETVFFNNLVLVVLTAIQGTVIYIAMNRLLPGKAIVVTPVLLGTLVGFGMLIPVVGMKLFYLPYAGYLFIAAATTKTPMWHALVFLGVSAIIVDTIPDIFIRPYLSSRGSLHMGQILLGYVLGTMAFGWYGLFLGPIIVVVLHHFAHTVFPWLAQSYLDT